MPADKFSSLAALKQQLGSNDWRVRCLDRSSWMTVIAPHGGFIEAGTSAIARAVAGRRYNLFDFQGLRTERPEELHVTATHFRDPVLCSILRRSTAAISIHGMGPQKHKDIWLGGLNAGLKELVLKRLLEAGFTVNPDSPLYRGESPRNVVNLANEQGVQLEISNELHDELFKGKRFLHSGRKPRTTKRFDALVLGLRLAITDYAKEKRAAKRTA